MSSFCRRTAMLAALAAGIAGCVLPARLALAAGAGEKIAVEIVNGVRPRPAVLVGAYVNGKWVGEVWLNYHQGPSPGLVVRKGDRVRIYAYWGRQYDEVTFKAQKKPERVQPKLNNRGRMHLVKS